MTAARSPGGAALEFCGEWFHPDPDGAFSIGRDADLVIDENPYLHRHFLELTTRDRWWWLTNVGSTLSATLYESEGRMQAWLAPGAQLPLVFATTTVRFSAGSTTYAVQVHLEEPPLLSDAGSAPSEGTTTLGRIILTEDQHLLVLALAEAVLRAEATGATALPTSADAARRLGWSATKFNRKLDNVCQKLERSGVGGLHGDVSRLASARRARLVEYAVAVGLVGPEDLPLLASLGTANAG